MKNMSSVTECIPTAAFVPTAAFLRASHALQEKLVTWYPKMPGPRMRAFGTALAKEIFEEFAVIGMKPKILEIWMEYFIPAFEDNEVFFESMGWVF